MQRRHRTIHEVGTVIEDINGYCKVKIAKNKWEGLGAHLLKKSGIQVVEGDRVFFADGDRTNRNLDNLRRIHFNTTPVILTGFKSGRKSRVIIVRELLAHNKKTRLRVA